MKSLDSEKNIRHWINW